MSMPQILNLPNMNNKYFIHPKSALLQKRQRLPQVYFPKFKLRNQSSFTEPFDDFSLFLFSSLFDSGFHSRGNSFRPVNWSDYVEKEDQFYRNRRIQLLLTDSIFRFSVASNINLIPKTVRLFITLLYMYSVTRHFNHK